MFQTKVLVKIENTILCSVSLFRKSCVNVIVFEKYRRTRQVTDGDMAHAQCMLAINSEYVIITAFIL